MTVPRLSRRQREVFTLVYAAPRTLTEIARAAHMQPTNAREVLAALEWRDLVERRGNLYLPARWVLDARRVA